MYTESKTLGKQELDVSMTILIIVFVLAAHWAAKTKTMINIVMLHFQDLHS